MIAVLATPVQQSRRVPDFLIIGAPKSGTTSLANALASHREIYIPTIKELSFFDSNWERGLDWFHDYFADARSGQLCGEATPTYLAFPAAAVRIAAVNDRCKLILLAREPVRRAQSHYWFRWSTGRERRTIDEVIDDELHSTEAFHDGYLLRHGMYARNLREYRRRFPASHIHMVLFEDMVASPDAMMQACLSFLGVTSVPLALAHDNPTREPRSLPLVRAVYRIATYQGAMKHALRAVVPEARRRTLRSALYAGLSRPGTQPLLAASTRARLATVFRDDTITLRDELRRPTLWEK